MIDLVSRILSCAAAQRYFSVRARFRAWLFGTPTSVIETFNAALLLAWGTAMLDDRLLSLSIYSALWVDVHDWSNELISGLFLSAAVFAGAGAIRKDPGADKLASFGLQMGAVLWAVVALNFLAAWPPLNTGIFSYSLISFFCWCAGGFLWERASAGQLE